MTEVRLRNVDADAIEVVRSLARRSGVSMERLLTDHIYELADREKKEFLKTLREGRAEMRRKYGQLPDSTPGIREERDNRW